MNSFDLVLFRAVNGSGPSWLDGLFLFFSNTYAATAGIAIMVVVLLMKYRKAAPRTALAAAVAFAISDSVGSQLLKPWIGRVRPCYQLPSDSVRVLADAANVGSMPSLHAANCFAVVCVLTMLDRRLALIGYPVAVVVALSRVYVGVHWPTDVLAGAIWGTLAAALAWWSIGKMALVTSRLRTNRTPAAEEKEDSRAATSSADRIAREG